MSAGCGCKGARFCAKCRDSERVKNLRVQPDTEDFSHYKCYVFANGIASHCPQLNARSSTEEIIAASHQEQTSDQFTLPGIALIEDFLNEQEEADIVCRIDKTEWVLSQSGRRKQVCNAF
jgi:alkylated DNA repair protein alkB family protein 4